jgi:hypothetical protein
MSTSVGPEGRRAPSDPSAAITTSALRSLRKEAKSGGDLFVEPLIRPSTAHGGAHRADRPLRPLVLRLFGLDPAATGIEAQQLASAMR